MDKEDLKSDLAALRSGGIVPNEVYVRAAMRLEWNRRSNSARRQLWEDEYKIYLPYDEDSIDSAKRQEAEICASVRAAFLARHDAAAIFALSKATEETVLDRLLDIAEEAAKHPTRAIVDQFAYSLDGVTTGWDDAWIRKISMRHEHRSAVLSLLEAARTSEKNDVRSLAALIAERIGKTT
jgi:hypothetical protein